MSSWTTSRFHMIDAGHFLTVKNNSVFYYKRQWLYWCAVSLPLLMRPAYVIRMILQYAFMMVSHVLLFVIMPQTTDYGMRHQELCWWLLVEIYGTSKWSNMRLFFKGWGLLYVHFKTRFSPWASTDSIKSWKTRSNTLYYLPRRIIKDSLCAPHKSLKDREIDMGWGGEVKETNKQLDSSSYCKLLWTRTNCTSPLNTRMHTHTQTHTTIYHSSYKNYL